MDWFITKDFRLIRMSDNNLDEVIKFLVERDVGERYKNTYTLLSRDEKSVTFEISSPTFQTYSKTFSVGTYLFYDTVNDDIIFYPPSDVYWYANWGFLKGVEGLKEYLVSAIIVFKRFTRKVHRIESKITEQENCL